MRILPFSSDDAAGNIINVPASSVSAVKDFHYRNKAHRVWGDDFGGGSAVIACSMLAPEEPKRYTWVTYSSVGAAFGVQDRTLLGANS